MIGAVVEQLIGVLYATGPILALKKTSHTNSPTSPVFEEYLYKIIKHCTLMKKKLVNLNCD